MSDLLTDIVRRNSVSYRVQDLTEVTTWDSNLLVLPFNSHERPRKNFSLQYKYNINQKSDENKEKYQFGDNLLIQF